MNNPLLSRNVARRRIYFLDFNRETRGNKSPPPDFTALFYSPFPQTPVSCMSDFVRFFFPYPHAEIDPSMQVPSSAQVSYKSIPLKRGKWNDSRIRSVNRCKAFEVLNRWMSDNFSSSTLADPEGKKFKNSNRFCRSVFFLSMCRIATKGYASQR